ncbi:hypothetical protein GCM10008940_24980 [Microbulbifer agarilyticus]
MAVLLCHLTHGGMLFCPIDPVEEANIDHPRGSVISNLETQQPSPMPIDTERKRPHTRTGIAVQLGDKKE